MLRYAVNATPTPRGDNLLFLARKSVLCVVASKYTTQWGWMEAKSGVGFATSR
jgi:hypothetical protein